LSSYALALDFTNEQTTMDLFPDTDPEISKTRVRDACEGGSVAEIVALVERMAAERRSVRQIVEAVRAFGARAATIPQAGGVWLASESREGRAWAAHWKATKGKSPPMDKRGGWRFPSRWPPVETAK